MIKQSEDNKSEDKTYEDKKLKTKHLKIKILKIKHLKITTSEDKTNFVSFFHPGCEVAQWSMLL